MNGSKDGIDVSFTVPTVSYGGTTLQRQPPTWYVAIDGEAKGNHDGSSGTPVSVSYEATGRHAHRDRGPRA